MKPDASTKNIWRSLDELAGTPPFQEAQHREFSPGASELNGFNRRNFLKIMGASIALASLPACTRQPVGKIVPYVRQPEELIPGKALYYATAMTLGGFATGLLVESHEGHPTKIEGNPDHPASQGATNIFQQASILDLYDPGRSQAVLHAGQPSTWEDFVAALHDALDTSANNGGGLRLLTGTITSPTLHFQIQELLRQFPGAQWHQFEPLNRDNLREGSKLAFGEMVETHYDFAKAQVVVSLEADFLFSHPDTLRHARDFASHRRANFNQTAMNRLYVLESSPSITGSNADHRLPVPSTEIENIASALAQRVGAISSASTIPLTQIQQAWVAAMSEDLLNNKSASIVIAGENQPPTVHALAHSLNHFLGNVGHAVNYTESVAASPVNQMQSLRELNEALAQDEVDALIILDGNPVLTAPTDFKFAQNLSKARLSVHLSSEVNETSALCSWHIPQNHFLESWSDARAFDGTISIIQPLILPLYGGKSAHELLDAILSPPGRSDYDIVHDFWKSKNPDPSFESNWRQALHNGLMANSALAAKNVSIRSVEELSSSFKPSSNPSSDLLEVTFRPDPTIYDGRFANNSWLQELPKPITKLTWDNAALISPSLARRKQLSNGDIVELEVQGFQLRLPVWITAGQSENSIALHIGANHRDSEEKMSWNVYAFRTSNQFWFSTGVTLKKTGEKYSLATTQTQHVIDSEERQILREATFAEFQKNADVIERSVEAPAQSETLFNPQEHDYTGYRWGMTIDLSACIGCNACILACQSENNIPVIGKAEVARGRIMHWIRVDDYFRGPAENPEITHQPVPCMQCENAPCEVVCPVGATLHDHEGLNLQVYNRCVGTRYCSNNCPYKVRRFNFFQYADYKTPSLEPLRNPNVTVRWRGVMEKCTYCIQRISEARINSESQDRTIRDGEIKTACQQVCPAQAIVFGDMGNPNSQVSKLKNNSLNFSMLGELNTRPRTTYLAKLRNPNPHLFA